LISKVFFSKPIEGVLVEYLNRNTLAGYSSEFNAAFENFASLAFAQFSFIVYLQGFFNVFRIILFDRLVSDRLVSINHFIHLKANVSPPVIKALRTKRFAQ